MKIFADLHLHTKYSRGTSKDMDLENLAKGAKKKGIQLLGSGDFTHPLWVNILKSSLEPVGKGTYLYEGVYFFLSTEVCNIFYRNGEAKKIHIIILAPDFTSMDKINLALSQYGDLYSDGRPILNNLEAKDLVKIVLDINPDCLIIPAHIWTPHFSLFGANSGFDAVEECFANETKNIYALETGLSSDPA
ncbi:MAG TPA: DNA helicase UvrD, partial [Elusimicrobia bacterium]|nr:DNA helicase UvrD [Elusimicrobiota bacterium]